MKKITFEFPLDYAAKFTLLQERTNQNLSQVIRSALALYEKSVENEMAGGRLEMTDAKGQISEIKVLNPAPV